MLAVDTNLERIDPQYRAFVEQRRELLSRQRELAGEVTELQIKLADEAGAGMNGTLPADVPRLLGEAQESGAYREKLNAAKREHDAARKAIQIVDDRIRNQRAAASAAACKRVEPACCKTVAAMAKSAVALADVTWIIFGPLPTVPGLTLPNAVPS